MAVKTDIRIRRSAVQGAIPATSALALGELAINTYDGKLFLKKDVDGTESIVEVGSISQANDATITLSAGTYLSGGGDFTTDQAANETLTFNHDNTTRTNNTSSTAPGYGGTFTAIDSITTNATGHVTAVNTKTITIPASDNTDTLQSIANDTTNNDRYITFVNSATGAQTGGSNASLRFNPSTGLLSATSKSFDIAHPTKDGMRLRYGSLEGPEQGVYVRGRLKNSSVIELPDYWTGLVDEDTITVSLTCIGKYNEVWVDRIEDNKVYIQSIYMIDCFYHIFAERKDIDKLTVEYSE